MPCRGCGKKGGVAQGTYGFTPVRWEGNNMRKVHGGLSGRTYRFDGYGSVVPIDDRDLKAISKMPGMKVL